MNRRLALFVVALVAVSTIAGVGVGGVGAQSANAEKRSADLKIYQPHYIDGSVVEDNRRNVTMYKTQGRVLEIKPLNFNASDVESVRIAEDQGEIRYDGDRGVFVFDSTGVEGTFAVTWVVHESVEKNIVENNTTRTVEQTVVREYEAVVQTSKTDLAHIPTSRIEQLRTDAENWSEVATLYQSVGNPTKSLESKLQLGANLVDAWHNPIKALSGDFGMAIQALFFSAGGLILFALLMLPHVVRSRRLRRENKSLKEKIGDYEEIDDALDEIFTAKRRKSLREKSFNEWFDDRTASWLRREFAPEPWSAFRRIMAMLSPGQLNGIVAGAMLDTGEHVAVVERLDTASDGGDPDGGDDAVEIVSARMVDADDFGEDELAPREYLVESSDDLTEEIAARFDTSTLESDVLRRGDVEITSVALPIGNTPQADDFVEELNVSIPDDFETREHFATVLLTIIKKVSASDFATPEGEVDPERDLANLLMGFAAIGGESYNQPYLRFIRDLMIHNIDRLDASRRLVDAVEEERDRTGGGTEA